MIMTETFWGALEQKYVRDVSADLGWEFLTCCATKNRSKEDDNLYPVCKIEPEN